MVKDSVDSGTAPAEDWRESSEFIDLLARICARFVSVPAGSVDAEIERALRELRDCLHLERCSLWQVLPSIPGLRLTHSSIEPATSSPLPIMADGQALYPYLTEQMRRGLTTAFCCPGDLPDEAAVDRRTMLDLGVKSVIGIPMSNTDGSWCGALAIGATHERGWTPSVVARCQLIAQVFAGALARNRLELALRESEARFRAVVETGNDGIIFADAAGKIIYRSPSYVAINGFSDEERIGHDGFETVHPDDMDRVRRAWSEILARPDISHHLSYRIRHKSGGWLWIETTAKNLLGNPHVKAVQISSRDITDRIEAEQVHQRYEMLVRNTNDVVLFMRYPDGRILDANAAAVASYGYSLDELKSLSLFQLRAPHTLSDLPRRMLEAIESGTRYETYHRRKDGTIFPVEVTAMGVTIGPERILMGVSRDISERRRAEEALREQQSRLAHLSRVASVGEMASGLAHELNQPLAAILNYAAACDAMLDKDELSGERLRSAVSKLSLEARRAGDIIHRWRSFVRDRSLEKKKQDLAKVILEEGLALVSQDLLRCDIHLLAQSSPDIPQVPFDAVLIQQVVVNLVQNAIDAMMEVPAERRRLVVRILPPRDSQVRVEFCDSGPGVPEQLRPTMFKSFATTKPQGLGLGLAISRSIVEGHGGRLDYQNNTNGGATFWFVLPVEE
jgi:PAS domain S-box-containing protein